ncbi:MAG: helix-turn-helix domain-containing protein, partial [Pseudonocardiaceae bacterium]
MTFTGRAYCPRCGARLRRDQPLGSHCDPCHRAGPDPARDLPPDFFVQDRLRAALGGYHFGPVFLEVRNETGWSQQRLGAAVGMTQAQISAIERGEHRLRGIETIAGVAQGLRISGGLLNFPDFGATVGAAGVTGRK